MKKSCLLILFQLQFLSVAAGSDLQQKLEVDIEDGKLDQFSLIEAAFIVSGVTSEDTLATSLDWFRGILKDIEIKNLVDRMHETVSAERLFLYFHTTWLKTYKKEATTLLDVQQRKEYNCVSATVLYNLTCDELGLTTEGFETPSHVYTIFSNFSEYVMVENTTSMGFNIIKNLKRYSQYLAQYFPDKLNYKIGLDRIYAYENSKGRPITNTELIGLIGYNKAVFSANEKEYSAAYNHLLLAQKFNADSRSNQKFEVHLYYQWGRQLFEQRKFYEAFEIFADATYRYDENQDFMKNCVLAFKNTLKMAWFSKDWEVTEKSIREMAELEILNDKDYQFQKNVLINWLNLFLQEKDKDQARRVIGVIKQNHQLDDSLREIEKLIEGLP